MPANSIDPTAYALGGDPSYTDPRTRRLNAWSNFGNHRLRMPFMTQVTDNLWHGGVETGLVLPEFIEYKLSLYQWEEYDINHELKESRHVEMHDSLDQSFDQIQELAAWVNERRALGPVFVHCFPPGTLVGSSTPIPIEDAREVIGSDGSLHDVLNRWTRDYDGDLITISTKGLLPIRATTGHPMLVVRPYVFRKGFVAKPGMKSLDRVSTVTRHYETEPNWVDAKDVQVGDYLVSVPYVTDRTPTPIVWPNTGHPNLRPVGPLIPTRDTAWMLGLFAADGGTQGDASIGFTLSRKDDIDRLVRVWQSMGLEPTVTEHEHYSRVVVCSTTVARAMRGWCGKGVEKRLPDFVIRDGWDFEAVVEGYVAGDGYMHRKGRTIACRTISPLLLEQVRTMLVSLGESPTIHTPLRHSGFANAKPIHEIQWSSTATQRQTAWWRGMYLTRVTSVEREHYRGPVHNLEVAEVNTFSVNGAVTHNCQAGLNRSSLVVAAALIAGGDVDTGQEAIDLIRRKRDGACLCNPAFESWVRDLTPAA